MSHDVTHSKIHSTAAHKAHEQQHLEQLALTVPIFRVAIFGAKGVGKTSIVNTFVNNCFDPMYDETEEDIRKYYKVHDIDQNPTNPRFVLFQIEDIFPIDHEDLVLESDQVKNELYYSMLENKRIDHHESDIPMLNQEKQIYGYIFVYDVNDPKSFEAIQQVIRYIVEYCESKEHNYSGFVSQKILVGNKYDQFQEKLKNEKKQDPRYEQQEMERERALEGQTPEGKMRHDIEMLLENYEKAHAPVQMKQNTHNNKKHPHSQMQASQISQQQTKATESKTTNSKTVTDSKMSDSKGVANSKVSGNSKVVADSKTESQKDDDINIYQLIHIKTSAKSSLNISAIFEKLGKAIFKNQKIMQIEKHWFQAQLKHLIAFHPPPAHVKHKQQAPQKSGILGCVPEPQVKDQDLDEDYKHDENAEFEKIPIWKENIIDEQEECQIF